MFILSLKRALFNIYLHLPGSRLLFSLVKKIYVPPKRIRKYLRFKGPFRLTFDDGTTLRIINYGNTIENQLFWLGANGWEGRSTNAWIRLCKESEIIFDVGANTGLYSLIGSKANPKAVVYAFEPVDLIFKRLKENLQLNNLQVQTFNIALADENGEGKIFAADTVSSTFDQASLNNKDKDGSRFMIIEMKRLDSFIQDQGIKQIDLMKIDVETFEPQVLKGMSHYLKKFAPTILIEILNNGVARDVESLVDGNNYEYYLIDEKNGLIRQENLMPGKRGNNFLLLNKSKQPSFFSGNKNDSL